MGFLDKAKQSLTKAVDQHGDKIEKGAGRLGSEINKRTGGKHADKVSRGTASLKKGLDSLDGKPKDDFGRDDVGRDDVGREDLGRDDLGTPGTSTPTQP